MGIEIKNLNFTYGNGFKIQNLDLELPRGKFITILGPNGSGKSTIVRNILGFLKPSIGTIKIDGTEIGSLSAKEKALRMSYVPQKFSTDFEFTVKDIVLMGRHPYLKRFQEASEGDITAVVKAMELTGTLAFSDKKVTTLSGGEAQRVSLARALAQDTPYIILDEPINHLDVSHQVMIMKILRDMVPDKTPIAVMHDINYSKEFSDYTILMDNGRVVYQGKPEEVLTEANLKKVYNIDFINLYSKEKDKNFIFPV